MYDASWSGNTGSSSPHRARSSTTWAWVRFGLRVTRSGEPGIARNSTNRSTRIAMIVTSACPSWRRK